MMIYILRKKGIKITGRLEDFEKNNYIPKAGVIRVEIKKKIMIDIKLINY